MTQRVVIVGTGGAARETLDIFEACIAAGQPYEVLGWLERADTHPPGTEINGYPVLGDFPWLAGRRDVAVVCSPGSPALRLRLVRAAQAVGGRFCNAIHPSAVIARRVQIGTNVVIAPGAVLADNVRLGDHVQVNLNCTLGHDSQLYDFATLAPGVRVSGAVTLETGCYIGSGATLVQGITVGAWAAVGIGSAALRDVEADTTVLGVPAREIQRRPPGWQEDQAHLSF